jgi:WD40 repeat protein
VWDIATGKEVATLVGNADTPFAVAFLGNDGLVMGGSRPSRDAGQLYFWGTAPARLGASVPTGEVYTLVSSSDGTKVAAWASRQAVGDTVKNNAYEVYDAKGKLLGATPDKGRNVRAATFTPDLSWVVAGDKNGTVRIFDLQKKLKADDAPVPIGGDWAVLDKEFLDIGVTPDKKLVVAADVDGTVKVADVGKRAKLGEVKAHPSGVRTLVVSPTGDTFATLSNDREVTVWSLQEFKDGKIEAVRSWPLPVGLNGAAYTPDGKAVVTANADGTATVLEVP